MRLYENLYEAMSEIQRDLAKGPRIDFTRVQQRTGESLPGRELLGYTYGIEISESDFPKEARDVIELGRKLKLSIFLKNDPDVLAVWLQRERSSRITGQLNHMNEPNHPALASTIEGNWPSYTYPERLWGAPEILKEILRDSPDSRRAFWPIFRPEDSFRAAAPTRIPCSLGYQVLLRSFRGVKKLVLYYLERSADYDNFLLTDIWLAVEFGRYVGKFLDIPMGQFMHTIISLHSFEVEGTEVY